MGSKGSSSPQTTTTSSSPPPQVMAEYQALTDRATNVANQPYQAYQGELVAPLSNQTQAGLGQVGQYANAAQPGYAAAMAGTAAAATPVSPTQFSGQAMGQFMNPYTASVVNTTQNEFANQNQQQAQMLNSNAIGAGAYGGDRAGVAQSILANQQQTAQAPVIAGLNQSNWNQALSEFNTQQQTGLQAQEYNAGQLGAMANQYGTLAGQAQQAGLQGAQANLQAGMIPQQEQQAIDTALQNQYLTQQSYPFQTTGWLGNIIEGTGSLSGGTGSTTSPGPSTTSQALGAATSGLGILGSLMSLSDARVKDDIRPIGKTFDGQTIYRFRFKGDPRTQIGLLAHETERKHPGAVGEGLGGLKHVDYGDATESAADRGHFYYGGMVRPGYQVGGETPITAPETAVGPNGQFGYTQGWAPGDALNPAAGVSEALFGAESAGSKNPYTGIDLDQINAIGGGQWMPPETNAPLPDYQHPGNDPQTAGAEASLAGLINRPGIETNMGSPSSPITASQPTATAQPQGGQWESIGGSTTGGAAGGENLGMGAQIGNIFHNQWVPTPGGIGGVPASGGAAVTAQGGVPTSLLSQIASGGARADGGRTGFQTGGMPLTGAPYAPAQAPPAMGGPTPLPLTLFRGGRAGFASGGGPQFTEVQYNTGRERGSAAPIYTALDLSGKSSSTPVPTAAPPPEHPAVTIARHMRAQGAGSNVVPIRSSPSATAAPASGPIDPSIIARSQLPPGPMDPSIIARQRMQAGPAAAPAASYDPTMDPSTAGVIPSRGFARAPAAQDPLGWSVEENAPPAATGTTGAPEYLTPSAPSLGGILRGAGRMISGPYGAAAGRILESSPAETGTLPPAYWPRDATGAPARPITRTPNVIQLPSQSTGRPPIALHGPSGPIDLGTWEGEGGAPGPVVPEPTPRDQAGELGWGDEGPVNYARGGRFLRAAGGMLGQSGIAPALAQPPSGSMMAGASPSAAPQGGFAIANQAAGFPQLYGAGRSGFAAGGDASTLAPWQSQGITSWVPVAANQSLGHGPPSAPNVPAQNPQPSQASQGADLSKAIEKIGPMLKSQMGGGATASPGVSPPTIPMAGAGAGGDASDGWGSLAGTPDMSSLPDDAFDTGGGDDLGAFGDMARGGRLARAAGGDIDPNAIDALVAQPATAPPTAPPTAPAVAAIQASAPPVSGNVGKGGYNPAAAIQQAFGDRAAYAATIANRESGQGANWVGDDGSSFGDFQLHYGGISQKYPHPGLGDAFTAATGMDARNNDPATRTAVANFVANYTAKHGWGDWSTAHDAPPSAGGSGGGAAPSSGGASISGGVGADGLPSPMAVPTGYFQPHDYSDPNSPKRELFGAMMAAGFGMMAGTSPYAAVNIGQGGLAGVNYLQKQQELDRDWMLNQSKIDQMSAQERRADADVGLRVNQWNLELAKYKNIMATNANVSNILSGGGSGGGGGGSGAAPATPAAAAPPPAAGPAPIAKGAAPATAGPAATAPAATAGPSGVGPAAPRIAPTGAPTAVGATGSPVGAPPVASAPSNVPSAQAQPVASPVAPRGAPPAPAANAPAGPAANAPAGAPGPNDPFWQGKMQNPYNYMRAGLALASSFDPQQQARGQELIKQAQEIWSTGMADGQMIPGIQEAKGSAAATVKTRELGAEAMNEESNNVADHVGVYNQEEQRLNAIKAIMQKYPTGAWADHKAEIGAIMNQFGFPINVGDPAAYQEFVKNSVGQTFDALGQLKGQPRNMEITGLGKTSPDPTNQPEANAQIIASITGRIHAGQQYAKDFLAWKNSPEGKGAVSPADFKAQWQLDHPIEGFVNNDLKNFAYAGQTLPPKAQRVVGQLYMVPGHGPGRWDGKNLVAE